MGGNSSMQHQRMKYMRHHGQQRFQFGQNFAQQSQTLIPPQNWTNPAGAEMGDSTVQATNPVSSQLQQSLAQLQNQRAHPIYYPSAQTGAPAADYNNQHKNTKYYPKQDYSKIQTWQGTSANPVGQKNRTWNNEVYQNQAGGLSSARPPASYRGGIYL